MRSEKEMLGLILGFAEEHEAVRAVVMNGSRVDPGTKKDPFQDYDIVYLVTDTAGFTRRDDIPGHFGDPMIVQLPGEMTDPPPEGRDRYVYLMQFRDGTRVDLSIERVEEAKRILADSLSLVLLDKDGALGEVPPPGDRDYLTHPPREKAFSDCCNEFWWLNPYVAKALWRDQLPCAKHVMESFLRPQLVRMLCWDVAVSRGTPTAFGAFPPYWLSASTMCLGTEELPCMTRAVFGIFLWTASTMSRASLISLPAGNL